MKLERSKNSFRNMYFGLINKMVILIAPFIVRTIFIHTLGAEYLGLNSLFSSILSVLSLTELGFSSAIVFSMYKPIAEDDKDTINALLAFYKKVYAYVGIIMLSVGCIIVPFLPHLINGKYPENISLSIVYLVFLFNSSVGYFLYAYLEALIVAFQRGDLTSKVNTLTSIIMYIVQIIILLTTKNYYIYILTMPLFTIINNIRIGVVAKKYFPDYKPYGRIDSSLKRDIREKINGLVIQKICAISRNAFDSIFISMFLGLTETAIYNNYYMILNAVTGMVTVLATSITSGIGNSVAIESKEKNFKDMCKLDFIYMWIAGWLACCMLCLYQPFMKIWLGESYLLPIGCVILLCIYFYALKMGDIRSTYSTTNGLWWKNRYRSIAEAISNLILNYVLGKHFGILGIILATVITIIAINFLYGGQLIFKFYFTTQNKKDYFIPHMFYFATTSVIMLVVYGICALLPDGIFAFIIRVMICIVIPNAMYVLIYRKTKMYNIAMPWLIERCPAKISRVLRIMVR